MTSRTPPHEPWGLGGGVVSTGSVAAATARLLLRGAVAARGALPPERCLPPDAVFAELERVGTTVVVRGPSLRLRRPRHFAQVLVVAGELAPDHALDQRLGQAHRSAQRPLGDEPDPGALAVGRQRPGAVDRERPLDDADVEAVGAVEHGELDHLGELLAPRRLGPLAHAVALAQGGPSVSGSTLVFEVCHARRLAGSVM